MKVKKMLVTGIVLGSSILMAACGSKAVASNAEVNEEYKPYGKYAEPVEFTIGRGQRGMELLPKGDTIEDSTVSRFIEEQSNIRTKVAWESADVNQKIALAISTGDIPDVLIVNEQTFKQLAENDLIADLTDVYDKAASPEIKARLESYDADVLKLSTIDGQLKAIPSAFFDYEHTVTWIRKDWVEKVGAEMPKTRQDLYDLAKLFVEKDVAGNGKTIGFSMIPQIAGYFGNEFDMAPVFNSNYSFPRSWVNTDEGIEYGSIQPETKEILGELRDLYADGVIDKQFAVRTADDRKAIIAGDLGIHFGPFWASQFVMQESLKNDPNADWVALATPENNEGKFVTNKATPIIRYMVVRKGYEHPEAVMRSLNLNTDFTFGLTDEAVEYREKELGKDKLFEWYYQTIDHKIEYSDANKKDYDAFKDAIEKDSSEELPGHLKSAFGEYKKYQEDPSYLVGWGAEKLYTEGLKAATDPNTEQVTMGYYGKTKTMETKWVNLDKLESETFLKIVMGEVPLDEFDKFVETWKKTGGDEITKEVNEEAEKLK